MSTFKEELFFELLEEIEPGSRLDHVIKVAALATDVDDFMKGKIDVDAETINHTGEELDDWTVEEEGTPTIAQAVDKLGFELSRDEGLFYGYQSNIAMAFVDELVHEAKPLTYSHEELVAINDIANKAAKRFLKLLIEDSQK